MKRIAIIVPTPDKDRPMTRRCAEIVAETTKGYDVDLQLVESSGPEFRISRSFNRGFRATPDADAWVLLNDDAWMDAGWLDALVDLAERHPQVGIVGAVLRFPDGRIQHAGSYLPLTPAEMLAAGLRHRAPLWAAREIRRRGWGGGPFMYAHWHEVSPRHRLDYLTGACALITRPCLEKVGHYDEDYVFGFEDADHSLRALEAGFELGLATDATGVHHEGASGAPMSAKALESEVTFRAKWPEARIRAATRRGGRIGVYSARKV